ncbi:MAG: BLUF domain-containing protein [Roseinatronobacter sp.]
MSLFRIIYTSRPFGFDAATLNSILVHARQANSRDDITGALICREDIYMQLLEGPEPAVKAALARIQHDDRHLEVRIHVERPVSERLFANWAMLHDPATSWIWSRSDVTNDAVQNSTPEEVEGFFTKLRAEHSAP